MSARNPWISRTVIPRAYNARILSSKPVNRRSCLAITAAQRARAIAWHADREWTVVGQHRFTAGAVSMICGVVGLLATGRVPEMVRQLTTQRALDDRFLEATDRGVELLRRDRALPHELIKDFRGNGRQWCVKALKALRRRCIGTPHVMPHTRNS